MASMLLLGVLAAAQQAQFPEWYLDDPGVGCAGEVGWCRYQQTLNGSVSAVSKPIFAGKKIRMSKRPILQNFQDLTRFVRTFSSCA